LLSLVWVFDIVEGKRNAGGGVLAMASRVIIDTLTNAVS